MDFPVSYLKEIMEYDPISGIFTCKVRTGPRCFPGMALGKANQFGHITIGVCCKNYMAHRLAYYYMTGIVPSDDMVIDHIDHNPGNNAWSNLRLVTISQNNANRGNARHTAHKNYVYPGVYFCEDSKRWIVKHTFAGCESRTAQIRSAISKEVAISLKKYLQMGGTDLPPPRRKGDKQGDLEITAFLNARGITINEV